LLKVAEMIASSTVSSEAKNGKENKTDKKKK
jgi:hypothetical protein